MLLLAQAARETLSYISFRFSPESLNRINNYVSVLLLLLFYAAHNTQYYLFKRNEWLIIFSLKDENTKPTNLSSTFTYFFMPSFFLSFRLPVPDTECVFGHVYDKL